MHDPRYANKGRKAIDVPNVTLAVLRALTSESGKISLMRRRKSAETFAMKSMNKQKILQFNGERLRAPPCSCDEEI